MGSIILMASLCILLVILLLLKKGDIFSPSIIITIVYIISMTSVLLYQNHWDIDINIITVYVIMGSIIVFCLGELFADLIFSFIDKRKKISIDNINMSNKSMLQRLRHKLKNLISPYTLEEIDTIKIPSGIVLIVSLLMLVIVYVYFEKTMQFSIQAGNKVGISQMIHFARIAYNSTKYNTDLGIILNQGILLSKFIAYFFSYTIIFNVVNKKFKIQNLSYFLPILIYGLILILSTQRATMMAFVSFVLVVYMILVKKIRLKANKYIFRVAFISIFVVMGLFLVFGLATGKTQTKGLMDTLMIYSGSSILALNIWIMDSTKSAFFGETTLRLFYSGLGKFGFDVPVYEKYFFDLVRVKDQIWTNVFTPFRRYIQDYGYTGLIIIQFMVGFIYGLTLKYVIRSKNCILGPILYAFFFYPIFFYSIEERIMTVYFSLSTIYSVFYILTLTIVFNKFIKKKVI